MTKIVGRDVTPRNKISWAPAQCSFPMRSSIAGNRLAGALALVLGTVWVSFFIDDIVRALRPTLILAELLMMTLLILPGVLVLLYGISQYVYHEETVVDAKSISWRRRGLSGRREWREPVSNYQGVLKEHQYWSRSGEGTSGRSSRMIYFIRLAHPDSGKEIELYRAESNLLVTPADWDEKWKQYAELFQLPVLEKTESGIRSSDAGDLETPLVDKIREGKLKIPPVDPDKAALGLMARLTHDGDLRLITCYPVWNAWKSIAGVLILAVAATGAYFFELIHPRIFNYFLWFIPVCVFAIGYSIRRQIAHPEKLAMDKKNIYYRYFNGKAGWVTEDMPLRSVCNISVKSNPRHFRSAADIVIEGKKKTIRFGWWLPAKTKLGIERVLLSLIARDLTLSGFYGL